MYITLDKSLENANMYRLAETHLINRLTASSLSHYGPNYLKLYSINQVYILLKLKQTEISN